MKKLSMLAAGVAVLSMCACTEANEFTPSTNNSTKKITEIKVSSNPSALGSRTDFIVQYDEYGNPSGAVNWVKDDELYFFKSGQNSKYQVFTCGDDASGPVPDYDWNYFEAKNKSSDGLTVGDSYYAYYIPIHNLENEVKFSNSCEVFYLNHYKALEDGKSEVDVLRDFMSHYDLLMSKNPSNTGIPGCVTAKEEMDPIYMDHAFALVTVDLTCTAVGNYSDYAQIPSFYEAELHATNGVDEMENAVYCLANNYSINENGVLQFTNPSRPLISTLDGANNEPYYLKNKDDKISFYFLVRSLSDAKKLSIHICTENPKGPNFEDSVDKVIDIMLKENFKFESGKCYHFGLNLDYLNNGEIPYDVNNHWRDKHGQITLATFPDEIEIGKVAYDGVVVGSSE